MTLSDQQIIERVQYYPVQFDGPNLVFVEMTRENYTESLFLMPSRLKHVGSQAIAIPFDQVMDAVAQTSFDLPAPKLILQIAHCGSTLLSRALDIDPHSLVLREPYALRQLNASMLQTGGGISEQLSHKRALASLVCLYSRRFGVDQSVLIKGNVPLNFVVDELHSVMPNLNGIMLYVDLKDYLISILKAEQRRAWAKHVVAELSIKLKSTEEFSNLDLASLTDGQNALILWLQQIRIFETLAQSNNQLVALNAQKLFGGPTKVITECCQHLALKITEHDIQALKQTGLFEQHAKQPNLAYTSEIRAADNEQLRETYANEIDQSVDWAVAQGFSLTHELGS